MFMQQMTLNQTLQAQVYDYTEAGLPLVYLYCTHFYHSPADLVRTFPTSCKLVVGSCEQNIKKRAHWKALRNKSSNINRICSS